MYIKNIHNIAINTQYKKRIYCVFSSQDDEIHTKPAWETYTEVEDYDDEACEESGVTTNDKRFFCCEGLLYDV